MSKRVKYEWMSVPVGFSPIDPNRTGRELERIRIKNGTLLAPDIVEAALPEKAVLHDCFEWDDAEAAERWRVRQARKIVQCIGIRYDTAGGGKGEVQRYYVSVRIAGARSYVRVPDAMSDDDVRVLVLNDLKEAVRKIEQKYLAYRELADLFTQANAFVDSLSN